MGHSQNNIDNFNLLPLPEADHYILAFSGGSDSTALLHHLACREDLKNRLTAIHVNHQVHDNADNWSDHCHRFCQQLGIPCSTTVIQSKQTDENSLREKRYAAFSKHVSQFSGNRVLITAHHLNDDIETMLFRFVRGTGLNGMTGITESAHHHGMDIFRPLINTPKRTIDHYLDRHELSWIEDSSNANTDFARNYFRHQIVPALEQFRPDALNRLKDSRDNLFNSLQLIEQLVGDDNPLPLKRSLSSEQLATYLYHWLVHLKYNPVNRDQLLSFAQACLLSDLDKLPRLTSPEYILINWQQAIYALRPNLLNIPNNKSKILSIDSSPFHWQHEFGRLSITAKQPTDLRLNIKFNQSGERIRLPDRKHHSRVKELMREQGMPPWLRSRTPYLYRGDTLLAVGTIISHEWRQWLDTHEAEYDWHSTHFLL